MMNYQDFNNLQEAYLSVYLNTEQKYIQESIVENTNSSFKWNPEKNIIAARGGKLGIMDKGDPSSWREPNEQEKGEIPLSSTQKFRSSSAGQSFLGQRQGSGTPIRPSGTQTGGATDPSRRVATGTPTSKPPLPTGFKVPPSGTPGPIRPSGTQTGGAIDPSRRVATGTPNLPTGTRVPVRSSGTGTNSASSSGTPPTPTRPSIFNNMPGTNTAELEKLRGQAALSTMGSRLASGQGRSQVSRDIATQSQNRVKYGSPQAPPSTSLAPKPNPTSSSALGSSDIRQKFASASARTATAPPSSPAPTPSAAPAPAATSTPPKKSEVKRQVQLFHTDLFDLVKGHLLDEGYADTEESALAIMANMSEEWRESIVEFSQTELNSVSSSINQSTRNAPIKKQQPGFQSSQSEPQRPTGVPVPGTSRVFNTVKKVGQAAVGGALR